MSARLDSLLDPERLADCARNEAANEPQKRPYLVQIKAGSFIVMEFGALGVDSLAVAAEYDRLKGPGQYLRVVAAHWKDDPLPVLAERNALETAQLREVISEQDWIAADLARNERKGERLARINDAHAMDLQIQFQGRIGELPR